MIIGKKSIFLTSRCLAVSVHMQRGCTGDNQVVIGPTLPLATGLHALPENNFSMPFPVWSKFDPPYMLKWDLPDHVTKNSDRPDLPEVLGFGRQTLNV